MAFASNLAAINAANASIKAAYRAPLTKEQIKEARALHFSIEKVDGEYHALVIAPLPAPAHPADSLKDEREGAFAFPLARMGSESFERQWQADDGKANEAQAASAAAFFASRSQAITADLPDESEADEPSAQDEFAAAQAQADKAANAQQATSELKSGKLWIHVSSCESPVKRVWAIADAMIADAAARNQPKPSRKEIQDECVRQGVASGTARTQYQAWKKANDNDAANAENAKRLSDALNAKHR